MIDDLQKKHSKEIQSLNETINALTKKIEKFEQINDMKEQISKIDEITKKEESQITTINEEIKILKQLIKKLKIIQICLKESVKNLIF